MPPQENSCIPQMLDCVNAIKIDVEAGEIDIVPTMPEILIPVYPIVCIEPDWLPRGE